MQYGNFVGAEENHEEPTTAGNLRAATRDLPNTNSNHSSNREWRYSSTHS